MTGMCCLLEVTPSEGRFCLEYSSSNCCFFPEIFICHFEPDTMLVVEKKERKK